MDAEILTTITGVAGAAKVTIEAVRAALAKRGKVDRETLALVDDLQARVFELREIASRLHEEKMQALQAKNEALEEYARLRAEIRQKEERAADRQKYQRKKMGPSLFLVREDDPDILYCLTCFDTKGTPISVQPRYHDLYVGPVGYHCNSCDTTFPVPAKARAPGVETELDDESDDSYPYRRW